MSKRISNRFLRTIWLILGCLSVAIGVIGIFLPVLPTTPLMILAAYFFARSSPRLEAKLLEHRIFGPLILDWRRNGAIKPRVKWISVGLMGVTLLSSVVLGLQPLVLTIEAVAIGAVSIYILTRPSH